MTWNPSQVIETNALAPDPYLAQRFVEHTEVSTPDRKGWAPPRKRPRRVYKKLAARGFAQRCNGPNVGATQYKRWDFTAPRLAAWLSSVHVKGWDTDAVNVRVTPMAFDTERGVFNVDERTATSHVVYTPRLRPIQRMPESLTAPVRFDHVTLKCHAFYVEGALGRFRGIRATTVFFVAEGSPPDHPVLAQRFESHVAFVTKAIQAAARGMSRTKRIATQTTYRPYKETAL